ADRAGRGAAPPARTLTARLHALVLKIAERGDLPQEHRKLAASHVDEPRTQCSAYSLLGMDRTREHELVGLLARSDAGRARLRGSIHDVESASQRAQLDMTGATIERVRRRRRQVRHALIDPFAMRAHEPV